MGSISVKLKISCKSDAPKSGIITHISKYDPLFGCNHIEREEFYSKWNCPWRKGVIRDKTTYICKDCHKWIGESIQF